MYNNIIITSTMLDINNSNSYIRYYTSEGFKRELMNTNTNIISLAIDELSMININLEYLFILAIGSLVQDSVDLILLKKVADKLKIPLIFWLHDDPYEFDYAYKAEHLADLIFTNDKWTREHYNHNKVYHLPLAGAKEVHYREIASTKNIDAFFAGVAYPNRLNFFRQFEKICLNKKIKIIGDWWPKDMLHCNNERVHPAKFADICSNSWFTFNLGRDFNLANTKYEIVPSTPGPRTFEVALAGSVQLFFVDTLEISEYFSTNDNNKEIFLFDSVLDVKQYFELIDDDPEYIIEITKRAQNKALSSHTYDARAREILNIVNKEF